MRPNGARKGIGDTMNELTFEERNLVALYNRDDRETTMRALSEMRDYLGTDETELRELTDSALYKLGQMRDEDFDALDLTPDFDTEDAAYGG